MKEVWKNIEGYKGQYQISSLGRVKSIERILFLKQGGYKVIPEKIMSPEIMKLGYLRIQLSKSQEKKKILIHVLVAKHFLPFDGLDKEVNHKDGNKENNCIENLEWVTKSENVQYSYSVLKRRKAVHKKRPVKKLSLNGGLLKTFCSIQEAAENINTSTGNMHGACNGRYKTFKGFMWAYE